LSSIRVAPTETEGVDATLETMINRTRLRNIS
jgi:hypothetical protein